MRRLVVSLVVGSVLGCAPTWDSGAGVTGPPVEHNPFVHQDGTRLVDGNGAQIRLRGVNLGGWLHWEGWIWGGGWQGETEILARLSELVGEAEAERFRERVREAYVTEPDIAAIARLGFNVVRVPLHRDLLERDGVVISQDDERWDVLDSLLEWCGRHGLLVVLDLHAAPGGQSPFYMADPVGKSLWNDAANADRMVAIWTAVATRYRDRREVAGFDLLNEPRPPDGESYLALLRRTAAAIRAVDPRHLIIVEGANGADDFSVFTGPVVNNQAYSFHMYTWFGDWRQDELDEYREISETHGFPMWNGEFGLNSTEMISSTRSLYDAPDNGLSGFAYWTWKMAPGNTPGLLELPANLPKWSKSIAWIKSGWNARPTPEEARAGLDEFVEGVRFENCTLVEETAEALREAE